MIKNTLIITNKDLENFSPQELDFLEKMIKKDFRLYSEIQDFTLDKLVEYRADCFLTPLQKDDDVINMQKKDMRLIFDTYDLNVEYRYAG